MRSCFERTHSVIYRVWINYFCTILLVFGKIYSRLFISNCAEIMWLPIQIALIYLLCYITLSLIIQKLFSTRSRYLRCICRRPEKFLLVHCLLVLVHIRTRQNGGRISLQKQISNGKRQCNITKAGIFMSSNSELVLLLDPKLLRSQECSTCRSGQAKFYVILKVIPSELVWWIQKNGTRWRERLFSLPFFVTEENTLFFLWLKANNQPIPTKLTFFCFFSVFIWLFQVAIHHFFIGLF